MGADISCKRDDPLRDYSSVQMQQGKVLLDPDWNEQAAVVERRLRALAGHVLGRATVAHTTPDACRLTRSGERDPSIGRGRMYVDGFPAEHHGAAALELDERLAERSSVETLGRDTTLKVRPESIYGWPWTVDHSAKPDA